MEQITVTPMISIRPTRVSLTHLVRRVNLGRFLPPAENNKCTDFLTTSRVQEQAIEKKLWLRNSTILKFRKILKEIYVTKFPTCINLLALVKSGLIPVNSSRILKFAFLLSHFQVLKYIQLIKSLRSVWMLFCKSSGRGYL